MRPLARLRALLLVLLFVGTGVVAPVVDGVCFHRRADPMRPHVEMRDNPACHGEWCVLSLAQTTSSAGPAVIAGQSLFVLTSSILILPPPSLPYLAAHSGQLQSRAPPAPLV